MKIFMRREWQTVILWSLASLILWYALYADPDTLGGALGFIATGIAYEVIHRVFGTNSEARA